MEQAHYPFAHDNVERVREEIRRQAEMARMQEQIAAKEAQAAQLAGEIESRKGYEDYLKGEISARNEQIQKGMM